MGPRLGFNVDRSLAADVGALVELGRQAVERGYDSVWVAARSYDPFQISLAIEALARRAGRPVELGIPVVPATAWASPVDLARAAATTAELTGGRFLLGVGVGHPNSPASDQDERERRPIAFARRYLTAIRGLLRGERVDEPLLGLAGATIGWTPPPVPLLLGALGPRMLRLSGEAADGVVLNWASPAYVAQAADLVRGGARKAGRDPEAVLIVDQIRVCIDDDVEAARQAVARQFVSMTVRQPVEPPDRGYRAHAGRLGLSALVDELVERRGRGESVAQAAEAVPAEVVDQLAYAGPAAGAPAAIRRLAAGADVILVRAVPLGPVEPSVLATLEACGPEPGRRAG
ncbi:MAG TPA: LLM class flavin-dependent oxidoreductase [Candidatus Limnocylindrales bacterium]|nr:LLM class flavin-dependent oxidoreductase [Candidatus Limnocylindrales bacterium]